VTPERESAPPTPHFPLAAARVQRVIEREPQNINYTCKLFKEFVGV
jgi:hypothetical protein